MADRITWAMPENLSTDVHQALRSWHTHHTATQLDNYLYTYHLEKKQSGGSRHLTINRFLMDAINRLSKTNPPAAELIQHRFLDQDTAQQIAYRLNISENAVYQRQRTAIEHLSHAMWALEREVRETQADRIALRLPPPTYTRLFGVEEQLAAVNERLASPHDPWLLALEGIGGVGKTTLADALARDMSRKIRFKEIAWLSARQQLFRLPGEIEDLSSETALTLDHLLDQLIDQLGLVGLARASDQEKRLSVRRHLKQTPSLVIVDNLETVADYRAIVPRLRELANPTKFLITTRYSLRGESGVYLLTLKGLSREAARAFLRYEARIQGLAAITRAPDDVLDRIHEATGGNPLAIRLIIGQSHTHTLTGLLERLDVIAGQAAKELLIYIHQAAWDRLDEQSRRIMQAMLLVPDDGGTIDHITAMSGVAMAEVAAILHRLTSYSLVQVRDEPGQRYYTMHQLTRRFVADQ
jgi:DNA polymerase III delta prime subunit